MVPNFDVSTAVGNSEVGMLSPGAAIAANPRVDATVLGTVGGTWVAGDTVAMTIKNPAVIGSPITGATATYTVVTGDTDQSVAEGIASTINGLASLQSFGIFAVTSYDTFANEVKVTLHHTGPVGNYTVFSAVVATGGTGTFTIANSGALSGGSGAVIPYLNFTFATGVDTVNFWIGQPRFVDYVLLTALVTQGMPIY